MSATVSSGRAHSTVGAFWAQRWATVVPHDPPPRTATLIDDMVGTLVTPFPGDPSDDGRPYTSPFMAAPPLAVVVPVQAFTRATAPLTPPPPPAPPARSA